METMELEPDEFWRMVTESKLQVDGPSAGYMWTGKQGVAGWEMYKTRAMNKGWLYQARRVCTQSAGGGGALHVQIQVPTGQVARLVSCTAIGTASAGATLLVEKQDEDGNRCAIIASIAAGANRQANLPSIGASAATHANLANSVGILIGPGESLSFQADVALQTETLTVGIVLLLSTNLSPTWNTAGSVGTPTLGASTISAANTLQEVYICPS